MLLLFKDLHNVLVNGRIFYNNVVRGLKCMKNIFNGLVLYIYCKSNPYFFFKQESVIKLAKKHLYLIVFKTKSMVLFFYKKAFFKWFNLCTFNLKLHLMTKILVLRVVLGSGDTIYQLTDLCSIKRLTRYCFDTICTNFIPKYVLTIILYLEF